MRLVDDFSRLDVTDYHMGVSFQTGRPTHFLEMVIQNSFMPKKTFLPKARYSLNRKGKNVYFMLNQYTVIEKFFVLTYELGLDAVMRKKGC